MKHIQMPVKLRVLQLVCEHEGLPCQDLVNMLKNEYPLDRFVNEKEIETYLLSLKAAGLIQLANGFLDRNNKLQLCYRITPNGSNRIRQFR